MKQVSDKPVNVNYIKGSDFLIDEEDNTYMFNQSGDLVVLSPEEAESEDEVVFDFAVGTFILNEDKTVIQTEDYYNKYYVCK